MIKKVKELNDETSVFYNDLESIFFIRKTITTENLEALREIQEIDNFCAQKILDISENHYDLDYINGQTLHDYIELNGRLSEKETYLLIFSLVHVLNSFSKNSLVHKDISADNIIIDKRGNFTLIDYGISRIYSSFLERDTVYLGKPSYAAPENYFSANTQSDQRSDIFQLGKLIEHV